MVYLSQFTIPEESLKKLSKHFGGATTREQFLAALLAKNPLNPIPWDRNRWLAPDPAERDQNIRYRLFKDLERKRKFLGMKREELLELLGPADTKDDLGVSYRLGLQPGFIRLDDMSLHFAIHDGTVIGFSFRKGG
ncbi:MAG: hypothetical protein M0D55_15995 [Elusimicrobiota bacterium]|nr:MAG: hypothetical protein M0D55_15995 [Elusimicrobiota bacterium]